MTEINTAFDEGARGVLAPVTSSIVVNKKRGWLTTLSLDEVTDLIGLDLTEDGSFIAAPLFLVINGVLSTETPLSFEQRPYTLFPLVELENDKQVLPGYTPTDKHQKRQKVEFLMEPEDP